MNADPIRGKTIQWTFTDGPMAGRTFEHSFGDDGTVEFRMLDGQGAGKTTTVKKYEVAPIGAWACAVSYLGPSGYTLTAILEFQTGRVAAFASNEKALVVQHGTFQETTAAKSPRGAGEPGSPSRGHDPGDGQGQGSASPRAVQ